MKRIICDFYAAEARGVVPLLLIIGLNLSWLIYFAGLPPACALFVPVLSVVLLLRAVYEAHRFREGFEALPLARQERIAAEYGAPHPCVPLYQGKAHLLSDCLLCRSRRTLRLFPAETLVQANIRKYFGRNRLAADLQIIDSSGKIYTLEFLGRQKQALDGLAAYLAEWGLPIQ